MKLAFLGSGAFGLVSLRALLDDRFDVALVVTQPPRRRRRRAGPEPTPVHVAAEAAGIAVVTPANVNTPEALDDLRAAQAELFIVAEYGQILKQELLDIPTKGSINVHSSLLPRHRGAVPIAAAIAAGDEETGITIQRVVRKLDAGPVIAKRSVAIGARENAGELAARLAPLGGDLLVEVVRAFAAGRPPAEEEQDESQVTVCRRFVRADGDIDWTGTAVEVDRHVRAMTPKPGAHTRWGDLGLVVRAGEPMPGSGEAGVVVSGFDVACREGVYRVREVVPAARKPMQAADFLNGYRLTAGERLG